MFLCPNGHKLYGSPDLQGRPGQCPQCNSRFLIPGAHAGPAGDTEREESLAGLGDPDMDEIVWDALADEETSLNDTARSWSVQVHEEPPPPPVPVSCHPLAHIIRTIWTEARGAGVLELRLEDGAVLVAESFSAELSQHEYGVFAVRGDDSATSVVIIPWDQITRVTLPDVAAWPADMGRAATPNRSRPDRLR
jgi:hypothetical protein